MGKALSAQSGFTKYFELTWSNDEKGNRILESAKERYDVINQEISLCGYYVIITSEEMSAIDALELYRAVLRSMPISPTNNSYVWWAVRGIAALALFVFAFLVLWLDYIVVFHCSSHLFVESLNVESIGLSHQTLHCDLGVWVIG